MNVLDTLPSTGTVDNTAPDWADYFLNGWFIGLTVSPRALYWYVGDLSLIHI